MSRLQRGLGGWQCFRAAWTFFKDRNRVVQSISFFFFFFLNFPPTPRVVNQNTQFAHARFQRRPRNSSRSPLTLSGRVGLLTDAVLLVPVQPVAGMAEALESTRRVLAALLAAAVVDAAFVHVWEMGNSHKKWWWGWASSLWLALFFTWTRVERTCATLHLRRAHSPPQWASPYMV